MAGSLPVINLAEAKFECTFGRGCEGICCRNGRPGLYTDEIERIDANLEKFLGHMRPAARAIVQKEGFLSRRRRHNLPLVRVEDGWCVFFHQGCILHKVGEEEGDKYRYKPVACALFPLARDENDRWYVRQKGYNREPWDLFCLDPQISSRFATESLNDEIQLAIKCDEEADQVNEP